MSAADLMSDLAQMGIRIESNGDRLRYSPRSAVTPDLVDRMKAHKGELIALLQGDGIRNASTTDSVDAIDSNVLPIWIRNAEVVSTEEMDAIWDSCSRSPHQRLSQR